MELKEIERHALQLMQQHGLLQQGWKFLWDNAKSSFGTCRHHKKVISLSRHLTPHRTMEAITNTILHEIAHALVGFGHGHGDVWKRKAREIGCTAERCSSDIVRVKGKWTGVCPNGHEHQRQRAPKRHSSCGHCSRGFDPKYLLTWTENKA